MTLNVWNLYNIVTIACDLALAGCFFLTPWRLFQLAVHRRIGYTLGESTFLFMAAAFCSVAVYWLLDAASVIWPQEVALSILVAKVIAMITSGVVAGRLYTLGSIILSNSQSLQKSMHEMSMAVEDARDAKPKARAPINRPATRAS